MRYLVIGDAGSMHIYNYVKNILVPQKYDIYILTLSNNEINKLYLKYYSMNNIKILKSDIQNSNFLRIRRFIKKILLPLKLKKIDICHIHSVYKTSMLIYILYFYKFDKLICTYWGGDIEDKSRFTLFLREICFFKSKYITFTTKKVLNEFINIHGLKFNKKLCITKFATSGIEYVKKQSLLYDKKESKRKIGVPTNKIMITCGYNAYPEQHHDKIIDELSKLPDSIKEQIFIVLPMQYGKVNQNYIRKVKDRIQKSGIKYLILEKYVPFSESALLSLATDIYIHMRDTDAFSNALKEQVYSGSKIICGKWLKYYELDELKFEMHYISSFEMINDVIILILNNIDLNKTELFEPIYNEYSQNIINKQWKKIIEKVIYDDKY